MKRIIIAVAIIILLFLLFKNVEQVKSIECQAWIIRGSGCEDLELKREYELYKD